MDFSTMEKRNEREENGKAELLYPRQTLDNPRQTPHLLKKEEENETDRRKRAREEKGHRDVVKIYIRKERACVRHPLPSPSLKEK